MVEGKDTANAWLFYGGILGLDVLINFGWMQTYGAQTKTEVQVSFSSERGSGTQIPGLSIEVDDSDETLARMQAAKVPIEYGPAIEPWGVRRFYVRDPFGKLVNGLAHN